MIAELPSYQDYATTPLKWINRVPRHWKVLRGKYLLCEIDEHSTTGDEEMLSVSHKTGVTPRRLKNVTMFMAESNIGSKVCHPGDVAVKTMWAWMAALGVSRHHGVVSPAYGVYRQIDASAYNSQYLDHLLRLPSYRDEYLTRSTGVTSSRLRLYPEAFLKIPFIVPPPDEQVAIVRYLDHVDRRIRRYIRVKQKLITLLEEQKQVIIHRAVTRGLNPDARLKPSGVEWLGDVPEHWPIIPLRRICTKFGSGSTPKGGAQVYQESGIPFLRSQNVHFDGLRLEEVAYISPETHKRMASSHVQAGDVLLNITGASLGRACHVPPDFVEANVSQHVCILRPGHSFISDMFLSLYLSTAGVQKYIYMSQNGSSREGLTLADIRSMPVVLPDTDTQAMVAGATKQLTAGLDSAIASITKEVALIQEYRTRLIADVVTGKLDVRAAAAALPDDDPAIDDDTPLDADEADDLDEAIDAMEEADA
jgi:type I restriction enzyme, S subunit